MSLSVSRAGTDSEGHAMWRVARDGVVLDDASEVGAGLTFDRIGADRLADEVAALVRRGKLDPRSPAADALQDYRDPAPSPRADRMAHLEGVIVAASEELLRGLMQTTHPDHRFDEPCLMCRVLVILDGGVQLDPAFAYRVGS